MTTWPLALALGMMTVSLTGCLRGQQGSAIPPASPSREGSARKAVLQYNLPLSGMPPMRSPLVRATVHGRSVLMIVDTGSATHALAGWLVRETGLETESSGGRASDAAGRTSAIRIARHPDIALEGWGPIENLPGVVVEFPPFFEQAGIGGLLSPQWIAPKGEVVVLDLAGARMSSAPIDRAVRELSQRGRLLTTGDVRTCGSASGPLPHVSFATPVEIEGHSTLMSIDTGADGTRLRASSAAGQMLQSRSSSTAHELGAGGQSEAQLVPGVRLVASEFETVSGITLLPGGPSPACGADGSLGIDILRTCRLLVNSTLLMGRCEQ